MTLIVAGSAVITLWLVANPAIAMVVLLAAPIWILNVALGGRMNDSPLDGFDRLRRFRMSPESFKPKG